jgi:hypothetical protein
MEELKYFHGLPTVSMQGPLFTTVYVPIHVYECVRCHYMELHGTGVRLKGKVPKSKKRK